MNKEYIFSQLTALSKNYGLNIESSTIKEIIHLSTIRVMRKGETVVRIGEPATRVGFVLDGILRCYYIDDEGNDITRGFSVKTTLCIDEGLFGYSEYICEWETLEDVVLMCFDVAALKEKIYLLDDLKNAYMVLLEKALQYKIYRENIFLVENASQRYVHFRKLYPQICKNVVQHHIATYLGVTPESLSRIRKTMKERNQG